MIDRYHHGELKKGNGVWGTVVHFSSSSLTSVRQLAIDFRNASLHVQLGVVLAGVVGVQVARSLFRKRPKKPPTCKHSFFLTVRKINDPFASIDWCGKLIADYGLLVRFNTPPFFADHFYTADWDFITAIAHGDASPEDQPAEQRPDVHAAVLQHTDGTPNILSKMTFGEGPFHDWNWTRRGIDPCFYRHKVALSIDELQTRVDRMFSLLDSTVAQTSQVDLTALSTKVITEAILAAMFGTEGEDLSETIIQCSQKVASEFFGHRVINPLRQYMVWNREVVEGNRARDKLLEIAQKLIDQFRSTHTQEEISSHPSTLAHLLRSPYPCDKQRAADVAILLFAGHATTAFSLVFTISELCQHPHAMRRLQVELDSIKPSRGPWSKEDLEKAKYLDCCLLESWRLWPTATGYARKLRSDVWYKDMLVPQGSVVIVSQLWASRVGIFDPLTYCPERWMEPGKDTAALHRMMPFANGPRECVDEKLAKLELKLFIAQLMQNFVWQQDGTIIPRDDVTLEPTHAIFECRRRVMPNK